MNEPRLTISTVRDTARLIIVMTMMYLCGFAAVSTASERVSSSFLGSVRVDQDRLVADSRSQPIVFGNQWVQNQANRPSGQLRSRSEVVQEVKRQYNAEVLKIKLNPQGSAYNVRILMPNGRVRQITVSAKR